MKNKPFQANKIADKLWERLEEDKYFKLESRVKPVFSELLKQITCALLRENVAKEQQLLPRLQGNEEAFYEHAHDLANQGIPAKELAMHIRFLLVTTRYLTIIVKTEYGTTRYSISL